MIYYTVEELDSDQQKILKQDNHEYIKLNKYYENLTLLIKDALVSKITIKCDSKVELKNLNLGFKKEFENDLSWKEIQIPFPDMQYKENFGQTLLYKIDINESQQVHQVKITFKDQTKLMKIYFIGLQKGEKQVVINKVLSKEGDLRMFFQNVSNGKSIQRNENGPSKSIEPYQNDYTNQQFGLRKNFSQLKSNTDIVDDFGDMTLDEKNKQRLALEKFQAEKNKQANKPQNTQQPQRYEEKVIMSDKRPANFHSKNQNQKPQQYEDDLKRDDYVHHVKSQFGSQGGPRHEQQKQEQNNKQGQIYGGHRNQQQEQNKQVQKELGYNDPQQQQKRNYSKESNKSREEFDPYKGMDPMDTDFMIIYDWEEYAPSFRKQLEQKGEKVVRQFKLRIERQKEIQRQKLAALREKNEREYYQNQRK
ncbi:hypothetical protein pb186bvf_009812 [Paramecium bursaria]